MADTPGHDVTSLLVSWTEGDEDALNRLLPLVEQELRQLARRQMRAERPGHLLQSTALVNEAYLKLVDIRRMRWQNRAHFFAVAARLMRRILVDAARSQQYQKRGGRAPHVRLDEAALAAGQTPDQLVALDDALQALGGVAERKSRVVELRYFAGLTVEETAEVLKVSPETVMRDWKFAKAWLLRELSRHS
ncbi:MAG TPA: sigma-70 family RNA polymerase sigma factor [Vicinamibacterales bacterium]|jgi:RNA polymerase sigma factor (TIGR02999 family)|nr:sigma-70 family RNA polymerase sigma factor [Vicinamibacterales bacterium]